MPKKPKPISIHLSQATSADLLPLTRLDIAANSAHPLIALSFPYPFQALKLFLAHLRFCFERTGGGEYRILVARLRCEPEGGSDADSGVDVSIEAENSGVIGDHEDVMRERGEIVGFVMWRVRGMAGGRREDEEEEDWDWLAHLPKGANMSLWKGYTEIMGSESQAREGGVGKHPCLSALTFTKLVHLN